MAEAQRKFISFTCTVTSGVGTRLFLLCGSVTPARGPPSQTLRGRSKALHHVHILTTGRRYALTHLSWEDGMEPASWQTTLETVCSNLCQIFFYFGKQIPKVFKGYQDLPGGSTGKEPACQCRRHNTASSIPGSGRSPGEGNGNPLQYSCLGTPKDKGA